MFIFSVYSYCFSALVENVHICPFFVLFPPFHLLRILFSSSTWWASHLRPRLAPARLPRWPRPRPPFTPFASHPSPRRTWSRSGPSTLQPPPLLQRSVRRAGTSSSTPPTQTSAAVSRSIARRSSRRHSSRNRHRCWWQTARLLGFRTRPAPPKRTRARRPAERCPRTPRPRTPRSLHSHNCNRHSSTCWNQAINRSRSCLVPQGTLIVPDISLNHHQAVSSFHVRVLNRPWTPQPSMSERSLGCPTCLISLPTLRACGRTERASSKSTPRAWMSRAWIGLAFKCFPSNTSIVKSIVKEQHTKKDLAP